ncbi:uncharacterized protein T551_03441 [Pneumocystis jirovecii RU7]|uniref:Sld7 C-terminal domain-containing protein n=1 Tax=Pneumocystis jirovecii (strain RU7) TaxID=1408657 RepID=A0A0W4ZDR2_PNEJ7|nr:uncharacterized protein T551_03441 [Pneumocystis jirovecii RU7]KTW26524.1 hypothetical protein T551_03441 [Pneumocystis jirovecii RU7]
MCNKRVKHAAFDALEKIWLEAPNWRAQMWILRVDQEETSTDIKFEQRLHDIRVIKELNTQSEAQNRKYNTLEEQKIKCANKEAFLTRQNASKITPETIPKESETSVVLVGTVRSASVPFWQCRGIKWQVKAADEHLRLRFARWRRTLRPSGDTETAWVLRWPSGLQTLLYGYACEGGALKVQCSVFDSGIMYNIGTNIDHARDTRKAQIKKANKESLRQLTVAALRLRGIMPQHEEFKQLVEQTSSAAIFAWRDSIGRKRIPLDAQQWVVERLIGTFLLEMPCFKEKGLGKAIIKNKTAEKTIIKSGV